MSAVGEEGGAFIMHASSVSFLEHPYFAYGETEAQGEKCPHPVSIPLAYSSAPHPTPTPQYLWVPTVAQSESRELSVSVWVHTMFLLFFLFCLYLFNIQSVLYIIRDNEIISTQLEN